MIARSEILILAIILIVAGLVFEAYPIGVPNLGHALIVIGFVVLIVWVILVVTKH